MATAIAVASFCIPYGAGRSDGTLGDRPYSTESNSPHARPFGLTPKPWIRNTIIKQDACRHPQSGDIRPAIPAHPASLWKAVRQSR
jgi:hypothetical protein